MSKHEGVTRRGFVATATGIAARKSMDTDLPVKIADLVSL